MDQAHPPLLRESAIWAVRRSETFATALVFWNAQDMHHGGRLFASVALVALLALVACAAPPQARTAVAIPVPPVARVGMCDTYDAVPPRTDPPAPLAPSTFRLGVLLPTRLADKAPVSLEVDLGVVSLRPDLSDVTIRGVTKKPQGPFVDVSTRPVEDPTLTRVLPDALRGPWIALRKAEADRHQQAQRRAHFTASESLPPEARRCAPRFVEDASHRMATLEAAANAAGEDLAMRAQASWSAARGPASLYVWAYAREHGARARDLDGPGAKDGEGAARAYEEAAGLARGTRLASAATYRAALLRTDLGQSKEALTLERLASADPRLTHEEKRAEAWIRLGELEEDSMRKAAAFSHALSASGSPFLVLSASCKLSAMEREAGVPRALSASAACARGLHPNDVSDELAGRVAMLVDEHRDVGERAALEWPVTYAPALGRELARRAVARMDYPALIAATVGARGLGVDVASFPTKVHDWPAKERAEQLLRLLVAECGSPPRETVIRVEAGDEVRVLAAPASSFATCLTARAATVSGPVLRFRATLRGR